jgi:hypothetical protein
MAGEHMAPQPVDPGDQQGLFARMGNRLDAGIEKVMNYRKRALAIGASAVALAGVVNFSSEAQQTITDAFSSDNGAVATNANKNTKTGVENCDDLQLTDSAELLAKGGFLQKAKGVDIENGRYITDENAAAKYSISFFNGDGPLAGKQANRASLAAFNAAITAAANTGTSSSDRYDYKTVYNATIDQLNNSDEAVAQKYAEDLCKTSYAVAAVTEGYDHDAIKKNKPLTKFTPVYGKDGHIVDMKLDRVHANYDMPSLTYRMSGDNTVKGANGKTITLRPFNTVYVPGDGSLYIEGQFPEGGKQRNDSQNPSGKKQDKQTAPVGHDHNTQHAPSGDQAAHNQVPTGDQPKNLRVKTGSRTTSTVGGSKNHNSTGGSHGGGSTTTGKSPEKNPGPNKGPSTGPNAGPNHHSQPGPESTPSGGSTTSGPSPEQNPGPNQGPSTGPTSGPNHESQPGPESTPSGGGGQTPPPETTTTTGSGNVPTSTTPSETPSTNKDPAPPETN